MDWRQYTTAFLLFSFAGTLLLYGILRIQPLLHTFDPAFRPDPVPPDLAMNTAVSFATTTTWQAYAGETTLSYFSQVVGLVAQNFMAGGGRAGRRDRLHPGAGPRTHEIPRQLLGGSGAGPALGPAAGLAGGQPGARMAGNPAELQRVPQRPAPASDRRCERHTRRHPATPHGAGGGARIHQEPRHQRRGLLQRERRAPLREPHATDERDHAAGDRGRPGRLDAHVRTDGRPASRGLAALLGDVHALCRRSPRMRLGRAAGQSADGCPGRRNGGIRRASGRQHGGQGDAVRHCRSRCWRQ